MPYVLTNLFIFLSWNSCEEQKFQHQYGKEYTLRMKKKKKKKKKKKNMPYVFTNV